MSAILQPLLADPHIAAALRQCGTRAARMAVVRAVRADAAAQLAAAVERVPRVPERIAELYRAKGLAPRWNLASNDDAVEFVLTLPRHRPSAPEARAAAVLRACVAAEEAGDVMPLADEALGRSQRATQARRRADKAGEDPEKHVGRNDRIRSALARLRAGGHHDAAAQVARQFDLTSSTIRRIEKNRKG